MIRVVVLLALLAPAAFGQTPPGGRCSPNEAQFPRLIGSPADAAVAALRAMPGIAVVRTGGPDSAMTTDHRPDRATVIVVNGVVARITCG